MNTTSPANIVLERSFTDYEVDPWEPVWMSDDGSDDASDCNVIAYTHERNSNLRQADEVRSFFADISTITSIWPEAIRNRLHGGMPFFSQRAAQVPLFEHQVDGHVEDYQLQRHYKSTNVHGIEVEHPSCNFQWFSDVALNEPVNHMFMYLGSLMVNQHYKHQSRYPRRLTQWTGWDIWVNEHLELWLIYNANAHESHAGTLFPVSCSLTKDIDKGMARFLPSLGEIEHATFDCARSSIQDSILPSLVMKHNVCQSVEHTILAKLPYHSIPPGLDKLGKGYSGTETPLTGAIVAKRHKRTRDLLWIGADPNCANGLGQLPIVLAIGSECYGIVSALLDTNDVDLDVVLGHGKGTLFEYACSIARAGDSSDHKPLLDEMADFAAGLDENMLSITTIADISREANVRPGYKMLIELRHYVLRNGLRFYSHQLDLPRRGRREVTYTARL